MIIHVVNRAFSAVVSGLSPSKEEEKQAMELPVLQQLASDSPEHKSVSAQAPATRRAAPRLACSSPTQRSVADCDAMRCGADGSVDAGPQLPRRGQHHRGSQRPRHPHGPIRPARPPRTSDPASSPRGRRCAGNPRTARASNRTSAPGYCAARARSAKVESPLRFERAQNSKS